MALVHSAVLVSFTNCSSHFISGLEGIEKQKTVSASLGCPDTQGSAGRCQSPRHVMTVTAGPAGLGAATRGAWPCQSQLLVLLKIPQALCTCFSEHVNTSCVWFYMLHTQAYMCMSTCTNIHAYKNTWTHMCPSVSS